MTSFLILMFGTTMLFTVATSRIEGYIKALAVQSFILFLMVINDFGQIELPTFIFLSIETLLIKTVIIPLFLIQIVRKNGILREIEPYISNFYSILIVSLIFSFAFLISYWAMKSLTFIKPFYFGISISTIITALFIITTRKKVITQVMGYIMLENGIFLLSLSIAKEMPFIVNLGVSLDIFAGIFLLGLFVNKIQEYWGSEDKNKLMELRD